jgi:hypothetical protein
MGTWNNTIYSRNMFPLEMFAEYYNLRPKIVDIKITTDSAIGMKVLWLILCQLISF